MSTSSNGKTTDLFIGELEFEPGEIPEPEETDNLIIINDENLCFSNNLANEEVNQFDEIQPTLGITSSGNSMVDENAIDIDTHLEIDRKESPIQSKIIIKREDCKNVRYKSLLTPNRMRSSYWKYFGFPSNDGRTYLTKENIVCRICNVQLRNSKNTTNLKFHIMSKHQDVVVNSNLINRPKKGVKKMFKERPSMSPTSSNMAHNSDTDLLADELKESDDCYWNAHESNLDTINLMSNLIITDLLPISTVSGIGFKNFLSSFVSQPIPKIIEIESQINYLTEKRKTIVQNYIINLIKTKQYSIILNKFKTYTENEYLMAIVNFINSYDEMGGSKIEQMCYIYNIVHVYDGEINYNELFRNLDLNKCISITVNYFSHSTLVDFLLETNLDNKIIIVPNFLDIIKNLIQNIFSHNNSEIDMIFKQICDTSTGKNNNWYNRWIMLENYLDQNSDICDELSNLVGLLINCLRPLKVTIELLQNEQIPNASLIKPLIIQLLENHFKPDYHDDHRMITEIKEMVNTELNLRLTDYPILSVLSFLDPRFTHLLNTPEIEYVRQYLRDKLTENNLLCKENKLEATTNKSLSGLDFFFILKKPKLTKLTSNNFDDEFDKLMNESAPSLEQCPIAWWSKYGYYYPSIFQLAKIYTNIPACYLEPYKIGSEEYSNFHKKRYLLDEFTEKILYLHMTESYMVDRIK